MFRAKPGNESEPEPYSHNRPSSRNTRSTAHRDEDTPRAVPPSPITIPKPQAVAPDRKSPNSRVFSSFRYLTTKRYNRVSTASMDAVDGTATNTVMGSPTASHQSSQFPSSSPPQRDPWAATEDWRVSEQAHHETSRRPGRRQRPGIVFDVPEDPFEETKRSRPARLRKSAPTPQPEPDAADVPAAEPDE
ncbi:unnamed protein product [Mycena citricolor]|uniref:Uncharacterized protein n=2 Tax=Mycena citricolor TaxID=2018698 RepID=A0AAD2HZM8_9AGAR|nr:unnamed protein product [Mycena citricolor]